MVKPFEHAYKIVKGRLKKVFGILNSFFFNLPIGFILNNLKE
jgi:hypothetical protein